MNDPKFTKGEWHLPHFVTADDCKCKFILSEQYCGCIGTVEFDDPVNSDSPKLEEAKANAHLMCAAPELFSALKSLILSVTAHPDYIAGEEEDEWHDLVSISEEAISKALGE